MTGVAGGSAPWYGRPMNKAMNWWMSANPTGRISIYVAVGLAIGAIVKAVF